MFDDLPPTKVPVDPPDPPPYNDDEDGSSDEATSPIAARSNGEIPTATPRPGSARDRQARRRQQSHVTRASARRPVRQIARPDALKLPIGDVLAVIRRGRVFIGLIAAAVFVFIVIAALGRLRNNAVEAAPNAIWIGTEWTYETPSDEQVRALTERLKQNQIGTVYAWVSWLQADQTWRGTTNFPNVEAFVEQFNRFYPEANLYGWVSLPIEDARTNIAYRLDDVNVQQSVADFSGRVVNEFGFDGVHLNAEPVWDDDQNFLDLLRKVRAAIGNGTPLSASIPPDWSPLGVDIPVPALMVPGTVWNTEYKQSVAILLDEMAIMVYNSSLTSPNEYAQWAAYQVSVYADAIDALDGGTELVIGIPTYGEELPGHDPAVENPASAAAGVRAGVLAAGDAGELVRGVAIYAEWETDDAEWDEYRQSWLAAPAGG